MKTLTLSDIAIPDHAAVILDNLVEGKPVELRFLSAEWQNYPIPLDSLMESLISQLETKNISQCTVAAPQMACTNAADEWNSLALAGFLTNPSFSRIAERRRFLDRTFGQATDSLANYFRIAERAFLGNAALAGIERAWELEPARIFTASLIDKMEHALVTAEQIAPDSPAVQRERAAFDKAFIPLRAYHEAQKKVFRVYDGEMTPPQPFVDANGFSTDLKTTVAIYADTKYLILHFTVDEPLMSKRKTVHRGRDEAGIWEDDSLEVFLMPDLNHPENGYQFILNSAGSLWDGYRTLMNCDDKWNAQQAKSEVLLRSDGWDLTLTVPWSDFGLKGRPEKPWLANFYRTRFAAAHSEFFAWAPIKLNRYYQPQYFGHIEWKR